MPARKSSDSKIIDNVKKELSKAIVGQGEVIDLLLIALLSHGHALMTGLPGLAKTTLVKSIARCFKAEFNRVQFTPDLMPADLTGYEILEESRGKRLMQFQKGPIFCNILLADEINRTPPKTQSALLQAMQEKEVSVGGNHYSVPEPFFVLATQNPLEQEGTYPLPEAQLDRFFLSIDVTYPDFEEELSIARLDQDQWQSVKTVAGTEQLLDLQAQVSKVKIAPSVEKYLVKLNHATRPESPFAVAEVKENVAVGSSPRGARALLLAVKAAAFIAGRREVQKQDVEKVLVPVLAHRIFLNYEAQAESISKKAVIEAIQKQVKLK